MRSLARFLSLLLLAGAVGCATAERLGDRLFAEGDFVGAASAYDQALEEKSGDAKLGLKRDDARARAVDAWLLKARELRSQGRNRTAVAELEVAMRHQVTWQVKLPPGTQRTLTEEIAAATGDVQREITALTGARRPLAAEAALAKHRLLFSLPNLGPVGDALANDVRTTGQESCRTMRTELDGEMPYWSNLTAGYCTHFGVPTPVVARPLQAAAVAVTGAVRGVSPTLNATIKAHLNEAFGRTVWFDPAATREPLQVLVSGQLDERRMARPVSLSVPWNELISYLAPESYQEPYTEYYGTYESHLVSVPHMESESYTYSCGYGTSPRTCYGTRMVSRSRMESRSDYVTKSRTAYRTQTRMVTRYRTEPRVFQFVATEHIADYGVDAQATVALPGVAEPLNIRLTTMDSARGLEHAVSFQPAGVFPSTPGLPTGGEWLARQLPAFDAQVVAALNDAWTSSFCARAGSTPEEAARCVYGAEPPPWALAVFAATTADDPKLLLRFARSK